MALNKSIAAAIFSGLVCVTVGVSFGGGFGAITFLLAMILCVLDEILRQLQQNARAK